MPSLVFVHKIDIRMEIFIQIKWDDGKMIRAILA